MNKDNFSYVKNKPKYPPQTGDRIIVYSIRPDMNKRVTFVSRFGRSNFYNPLYGFKLIKINYGTPN